MLATRRRETPDGIPEAGVFKYHEIAIANFKDNVLYVDFHSFAFDDERDLGDDDILVIAGGVPE